MVVVGSGLSRLSPPTIKNRHEEHVVELAQLGERLVCNQEVTGSSPVFSTNLRSGIHAKGARRSLGEGGPAGF